MGKHAQQPFGMWRMKWGKGADVCSGVPLPHANVRRRGLKCKDGLPRLREQVRRDDGERGIEPCLVGSRLGGRVRPPVLPSSFLPYRATEARAGEGTSSLLPLLATAWTLRQGLQHARKCSVALHANPHCLNEASYDVLLVELSFPQTNREGHPTPTSRAADYLLRKGGRSDTPGQAFGTTTHSFSREGAIEDRRQQPQWQPY